MDDAMHEAVREALLDLEPGEALDAAHAAHLEACEACEAFARALQSVDEGLAELPVIEAPPSLVERTAEAVAKAPREREPARGTLGLFGALLAGLLSGLGSLLGLLVAPFRGKSRGPWAIALPAVAAVLVVVVGGIGTMGLRSEDAEVETAAATGGDLMERHAVLADEAGGEWSEEESGVGDGSELARDSAGQLRQGLGGRADNQRVTGFDGLFWAQTDAPAANAPAADEGVVADRRGEPSFLDVDGRYQVDLPPVGGAEVFNGLEEDDAESPDDGDTTLALRLGGNVEEGESTTRGPTPPQTRAERIARLRAQPLERALGLTPENARRLLPSSTSSGTSTVVLLPEASDATEGLRFRSPTGYWANTYLPGDPAIRALRLRLADEPAGLALAELALPSDPSFEAPRTGALALAVEADRAGVEGPTRVRMSVGLRGAAQRAGRRPTLRTQVLLDLRRPLDEGARGRVRALLDALARRQSGGDAIGLVVAGPDGGARIELGTMRFGELTVALRRVFGAPPEDATAVALRPALEDAIASLGQASGDEPLGSSMVLLVTPGLDEADGRELASVAHVGALAGVSTTVVALGPDAALAPMERVALAGQGRRRVLAHASEAEDLAVGEITAVSRVVARAVRVRIRLAEGVRLVDVLGSRSLDEVEATRVREAEQAIDRALAARLGIASDRGEDEDGIQIVVPAFYADDTHRILLDLVVPGPGPVADVQVRYKDLVRLGNATLTDRLELSRGAASRGPAQRAVAVAVLGHRVAEALREAAAQLDAGRPYLARVVIERGRVELEASTRALPELASDPAVGRDATLLRRYAEVVDAQPADALARSLRYAAHRRVLGDPLGLSAEP